MVRDRIIDGTLRPGAQLGEVNLAAELDVGRGPLREALARLVQEGLAVARPHRGVFVIELGEADIADVYLARRAIERTAASLVAADADPALLRRLDVLVERMARAADRERWPRVVTLDRDFHRTLVDGAASPRLSRLFATLLAETAMCMGALESAYTVRREIVDEHATLVEALRQGDEDTVCACVDHHLDQGARQLTGPSNGAGHGG